MIKVRIDGKDKWLNDAEFAEYRAKQEKKNLARRAAEKAKRLAAKAKEDKHKAKLQRAKDALLSRSRPSAMRQKRRGQRSGPRKKRPQTLTLRTFINPARHWLTKNGPRL